MAPIADDDYFSRRFRRYAVVAAFVFDADQEFTVFTCWGELKAVAIVERHLGLKRMSSNLEMPVRYSVTDLGQASEFKPSDLGDRSED